MLVSGIFDCSMLFESVSYFFTLCFYALWYLDCQYGCSCSLLNCPVCEMQLLCAQLIALTTGCNFPVLHCPAAEGRLLCAQLITLTVACNCSMLHCPACEVRLLCGQ